MRSLVAVRNATLLISLVVIIACTFSWEPISEALYFDSSSAELHSVSHAAHVSQQATGKLGDPVHRGQSSSGLGPAEDVTVEIPVEAEGAESVNFFEDESEDESDESGEEELNLENPLGLHPGVPDNQHAVVAPEAENRFEVMSTQHQYALPSTMSNLQCEISTTRQTVPTHQHIPVLRHVERCHVLHGSRYHVAWHRGKVGPQQCGAIFHSY